MPIAMDALGGLFGGQLVLGAFSAAHNQWLGGPHMCSELLGWMQGGQYTWPEPLGWMQGGQHMWPELLG
eukprot:1159949-Pelagomonas_calceolata.AAC.5